MLALTKNACQHISAPHIVMNGRLGVAGMAAPTPRLGMWAGDVAARCGAAASFPCSTGAYDLPRRGALFDFDCAKDCMDAQGWDPVRVSWSVGVCVSLAALDELAARCMKAGIRWGSTCACSQGNQHFSRACSPWHIHPALQICVDNNKLPETGTLFPNTCSLVVSGLGGGRQTGQQRCPRGQRPEQHAGIAGPAQPPPAREAPVPNWA